MLSPATKRLTALLAALLLAWALAGCASQAEDPLDRAAREAMEINLYLEDYRRIPGVTAEEIAAIEALKASRRVLHLGTFRSGEAFVSRSGAKGGFLIEMAESLSAMLGLEIRHEYVGRRMLQERLLSGHVDLACEIPYNGANLDQLALTTPIFERLIRVYRRRGEGRGQEPEGAGEGARAPRYGFLEGSFVAELVLGDARRPVEPVIVPN